MYKMVKNIYSNVKYKMKTKEGLTNAFDSTVGIKQGCNLSLKLFMFQLALILQIHLHVWSMPAVLTQVVTITALIYQSWGTHFILTIWAHQLGQYQVLKTSFWVFGGYIWRTNRGCS